MSVVALISREELKAELEGSAPPILIDALPADIFRKQHIPGAPNIPSEEVVTASPRLVRDRSAPIVVYCGSRSCQRSRVAAERLARLGYTHVREYQEGREDWVAAGLPVESG